MFQMTDFAFYASFLVTAISAIILYLLTKKQINLDIISSRRGKKRYFLYILISGILSGLIIFPILVSIFDYFKISTSQDYRETLVVVTVFNFLFALVIGLLSRVNLSWESLHTGRTKDLPVCQVTDMPIDKNVLEEKILEAMRATKEFINILRANNLGWWADEFTPVYSLLEKRNFIGAISLNKRYMYGGMGSLSDIYVDNQQEFERALGHHSQALTNIRIYTEFGVNRASLFNQT